MTEEECHIDVEFNKTFRRIIRRSVWSRKPLLATTGAPREREQISLKMSVSSWKNLSWHLSPSNQSKEKLGKCYEKSVLAPSVTPARSTASKYTHLFVRGRRGVMLCDRHKGPVQVYSQAGGWALHSREVLWDGSFGQVRACSHRLLESHCRLWHQLKARDT